MEKENDGILALARLCGLLRELPCSRVLDLLVAAHGVPPDDGVAAFADELSLPLVPAAREAVEAGLYPRHLQDVCGALVDIGKQRLVRGIDARIVMGR